jgi:hypothetical protein
LRPNAQHMKSYSIPRASAVMSLACASLALTFAAPAKAAGAALPKVYRFTSTNDNTIGAVLRLNHPALNGKSTLRLIIGQVSSGVLNPHPIGLHYNPASKQWLIRNEDEQNIPANSKFNVMVAPTAKRISVTPTNVDNILSFFPTQKGNPNAILLTSHIVNPVLTLSGTLHTKNIGLYFNPASNAAIPSSGRWTFYQEDSTPPIAAVYNVGDFTKLKQGTTSLAFRHSATTTNTIDGVTTITNAATDGKPDAAVFVQHVFTAAGDENVNEVLGVSYADGKWKIFTQDQDDLPVPTEFMVTVIPTITQ